MNQNRLSKQDFIKALRWMDSAKLNFEAEAVFAVLYERAGQKNVEINLAQIVIEYVTRLNKEFKKIDPSFVGLTKILTESEVTSKQRKRIVKGLKNLCRLNFLEIVESKNWKEHIVNIYPTWK